MTTHEAESHEANEEPCGDECPECQAILEALTMEADLRACSLQLWVAGWSPIELMEEVVRTTGMPNARDFIVQVLLVDDSHRSDQARTPAWNDRITTLRAMTGIDDVAAGWLIRWFAERGCSVESECIANGTMRTLYELIDPRVAA